MIESSDMRLLLVEDDPTNLSMLERLLVDAGYDYLASTGDPQQVAQLCGSWKPDLVLLDLHASEVSAYHVMAMIREFMVDPENVPVLVVTSDGSAEARNRALSMGARDFLAEPIDHTELLLRVRNLLHTRQLQKQLREQNASLDRIVGERTAELEQAQRDSLNILASIGEYHDEDTREHTQRVGLTAALIASALDLPASFINAIRVAAPLHDIGKVGVSRRVLLKPGELTQAERIGMMRHVEIGARILASARSPVLRLAAEIARTHHERWDGRGYMEGLVGGEIPLAGRITAVADVFDALTHDRPYENAWSIDRALAEIVGQASRHFDPQVVRAFTTLDLHEVTRGFPGDPAEAQSEAALAS